MTQQDAVMILATLKVAFPHAYKDLSKEDAQAMVNLWERQFKDFDGKVVMAAVDAYISSAVEGYAPTIGAIKEKLLKFAIREQLTETEAWALVNRATQNGSYGFKKEFDKLPPIVQKAVGSAEQIRAWAGLDAEEVQTVVASNFMRTFRVVAEREREKLKYSQELRDLIDAVNLPAISEKNVGMLNE